ncbi:MAG: mannose-1-phosphate guanylyltransferase [Balneolaceae bacterium]
MIHAVIMAGGSGTRFWPRSTNTEPKQFLNLFGDRSLIQNTVDRLQGLIPESNCWVVTNEQYVDLVRSHLPEIREEQIIAEPVAKNTAPCIASAAALIRRVDPEGVMVVLPADHVISDPDAFRRTLTTAIDTARVNETLVTIGIPPTHPETGYGYIQMDQSNPITVSGGQAWAVSRFTEKPDEESARTFLQSDTYLWNSGMFIWSIDAISREIEKNLPDIYREMMRLAEGKPDSESIKNFYHACPSVSIDYGIMEHAGSVHVVRGEFGWSDVGSWQAVYTISEKDENRNTIHAGPAILKNSAGNYICSNSGKLISLIGIEDVAVVETDHSILICKLDQSQQVKEVVEELKQDKKRRKFL